jgi:hypothetical protein
MNSVPQPVTLRTALDDGSKGKNPVPAPLTHANYPVPYTWSGKCVTPEDHQLEDVTKADLSDPTHLPVVNKDGHDYLVANGRYIPLATWARALKLSPSQAINRVCEQLSNAAESSIFTGADWPPEKIEEEKKKFDRLRAENPNDPDCLGGGAQLIGACITRLRKLATGTEEHAAENPGTPNLSNWWAATMEAYATALRFTPLGGIYQSVAEALRRKDDETKDTPLQDLSQERQADRLGHWLLCGDFNGVLLTRSGTQDRDESLNELISEVVYSMGRSDPEICTMQNRTRVDKISKAMNGMEDVLKQMHELCKKLPDNTEHYNHLRAGTEQLLTSLVHTAQMRLGVDPDDEWYSNATSQDKGERRVLREVYRNVADVRYPGDERPRHIAAAPAIELITRGLDLIDDMSRNRNDMPKHREYFAQLVNRVAKQEQVRQAHAR